MAYLILSTGILSLAYTARADRMRGYPVNTAGVAGITSWSDGGGHVFWHPLYLGLGVVSNHYGIRWNDNNARAYVKRVDPTAPYLSARYESALRKRVIYIARARSWADCAGSC